MKNIIVPLDFSQDSINALDHAIEIANKLKAGITMVHVKKKKAFYAEKLVANTPDKQEDATTIDYFDEILSKVKDKIETNIEYNLRSGKIFQEIINQAKYSDSYMIVMGTHGISGFEERWIGSNAYRVVSNSPCPVISIRMDYMLTRINKIVVPIDSTNETMQKVPFIAELAKVFDAEVHVISVIESGKKQTEEKLKYHTQQAEEYLKSKEIIFSTEKLQGKNPADITIEFALSIGAHLIGIMTEQTESSKNLWLGPYAQQLVNHSPIPVLSVQPY